MLQDILEFFGNKFSISKSETIIKSLCKAYNDLREREIYVDMLLSTLNTFFESTCKSHQWTRQVFGIFDEVFSGVQETPFAKRQCLKFFSKLCKIDIGPVYLMRAKIIDFLGSIKNDDQIVDSCLELIKFLKPLNYKNS